MIGFRKISCIAVFFALGTFISFHARPAFAQDALAEQCIKFSCQQSTKPCNSGGFVSTVTVDANTAVQGCPSAITVWYEGRSSTTPFPYYSCGCRRPNVTKITK
jgi:hypothetical protein